MAYTPVPYKADGDPGYTAGNINAWIANNMASMPPDVFTAKGDLFVATGADAGIRVAIGTNGKILAANSAQTAGVNWVYDQLTDPVQAKGDIISGDVADSVTRTAVGANKALLTARSAGAGGIAWEIWEYADPMAAKGDMVAYSGSAISRVAAGSNEGHLEADSSQTAGVVFKGPHTARVDNISTSPLNPFLSGQWNPLPCLDTIWEVGGGISFYYHTRYFAPVTGYYLITAMYTADADTGYNTNEVTALRATVEDVDWGLFALAKISATMASYNPSTNGMIIVKANAGDRIQVEEYHDSGNTHTPSAADEATYWTITRLGGNT